MGLLGFAPGVLLGFYKGYGQRRNDIRLEEVEADDETLDKEKIYHKRWNRVDCRRYHTGRHSHVPLIKMDGSE